MIVNFAIFPIGQGESLSRYVALVFKIIEESGLPHEHHEMGTNIEGEWKDISVLVEQCLKKLQEVAGRIYFSITSDVRKGNSNRLRTKVASAMAKM